MHACTRNNPLGRASRASLRLAAAAACLALCAHARAAQNAAITITVRVVGPPHIESLSASSGPDGSQIELRGTFFGDARGASAVVFGPAQAESPEYIAWADSAIICRVPFGLALGPNDVRVVKDTLPSNAVPFNVTDPTELCVDASNTTGTETGSARWPFNTIGEAVAASTSGDAIKVAAGTYREAVAIAGTILYLRGGYAGGDDYAALAGDFGDANRSLDRATNATILDGDLARRCVDIADCPGGELSGLIIRNGATLGRGGGIRCISSSPVIQACTIAGNNAAQDGGGVWLEDSTPALTHNIIRDNAAGGRGGGIAAQGGAGNIAHNEVFGNRAQQGGGVCVADSDAGVRNNLLAGNAAAEAGGGIAVLDSGTPALTNNTIADNRGGGLLAEGGVAPVVKHCIFWGNAAEADPDVACGGGAAPNVSFSNLQGALPTTATDGGENRSEAPLFAAPGQWLADAWDHGDYHLKSEAGRWTPGGWAADTATSPCIDVGDLADGVGAEPPPNGGCINLGAYGGTSQASKSPPPSVRILAADPTAAETLAGQTPDTGLFRIRRIGRLGDLAVNFIRAGTATFGTDYTLSVAGLPLVATSVTIPHGQDDVEILLQPIDDTLVEDLETAVLILLAGQGYRLDPDPARHAAWAAILDNEECVGIAATMPDAAEPDDNGMFRITRSATTPGDLLVNLAASGTASAGKDYLLRVADTGALVSKSVAVPEVPGYVDIEVVVIDDALAEGTETVLLSIVKPAGFSLDPTRRAAAVTIADDEAVASIAATGPEAAEPGDNGMFRISRSGGGPPELLVAFSAAGSAKRGADYVLHANGQLLTASAIAVPETPGYVDIELIVIDDAAVEPTESATLTLAASRAYALDPDPTRRAATVTIADDEPAVSIAATDPEAAEPGDGGTFRISRTGGGPQVLNVTFSRSGTATFGLDYKLQANGAPLTTTSIPVWADPGHVDIGVLVIDDTVPEGTESVVLTLAKPSGYALDPDPARRTATVAITDDEPTVGIIATDPNAAEPGDPGAFRIFRANGGPPLLNVAFARSGTAKSGSDYLLRANGALLIANSIPVPADPGHVDIELVVTDDAAVEPTETAILTIVKGIGYGVDGAAPSAAVSIADDEPVVSIEALDPAAAEPASPGLFRISRAGGGPPDLAVKFSRKGTAKFAAPGATGGDYTLFAAGQPLIATTVVVPADPGYIDIVLMPLDDTVSEPPEAATLILGKGKDYGLDPVASRRSATVWIADDDSAAGGELHPPKEGIGILVIPNRGTAPLEVIAIAIGVDLTTDCNWDFGDETTASGLLATHIYWSPGTYTITLQAKGQTVQAIVAVE